MDEAGPSRIRSTTSTRHRRRGSSHAPEVKEQEEHVEDVKQESVELESIEPERSL